MYKYYFLTLPLSVPYEDAQPASMITKYFTPFVLGLLIV